MKKIVLTTICFLIACISVYSQEYDEKKIIEDAKEKKKILSTNDSLYVPIDMEDLTAGQHLQKAAKCIYAGHALSALAVVPLVLPAFSEGTTDKATGIIIKDRTMNYFFGAVLGVGGIVSYFVGISHIKKAGDKLELTASQNSIGLVFKF